MKSQEIKFKSKDYNYSIIIGKNTLNILPERIKVLCPKTKNIALIIDKNIPTQFKKFLKKKLKKFKKKNYITTCMELPGRSTSPL